MNLWAALDAMRHSRILVDYPGKDYLDIHPTVKQAEFDAFMEGIHAREYAWYL